MHFLFEIDGFNALDHLTPVASELLTRGNSVTFVLLRTSHLENNLRVEFLRKNAGFQITTLERVSTAFQRWMFNQLSRVFFGRLRNIFANDNMRLRLLKRCSSALRILQLTNLKSPDVAVSGWGDPSSLLMIYARRIGAHLVSLPHGYPCVKNSNFNPHISAIRRLTGQNPNFSLRNHFDVYVVATRRNRDLLLDWSIHQNVVAIWGNARFCPSWIKTLEAIVPPFELVSENKRQRVLVFLPAATSGFKKDLVHSLIRRLSREDISLIVKPHTREGQHLGELLPGEILALDNVFVEVDTESSSLMRWADTVINFATGTAIEALMQGKRIIFTRYLTDNQLSWEDCRGIAIAESEDDVVDFLRDQNWGGDAKAIEPYLRQEVFADGTVSEPITHYADQLERLAKSSGQ